MNTETFEPTTEPVAPPPIEERPVHMGRCAECGHTVRFRPNSSGTGFFLVDTQELYGIGAFGRPICPDGHGEMEIADDRLPIEAAIEQAAERLDTSAQRLPFPVPPFNYEGVLRSILEQRHEIAKHESTVEARKSTLKLAKDRLDEANALLGRMIDQFEKDEQDRIAEIARREARAAAGHPEETNLVRCIWEEAHPGEACPCCGDPEVGANAARDSAAHLDEVVALLELRAVTAVSVALEDIRILVEPDAIRPWSLTDREAVTTWATAIATKADKIPARPAILGTGHIAGDVITSEAEPGDTFQSCRECDARLVSVKTGEETLEPFQSWTFVGTDCPAAKEPARKIGRRKKAK